MPARLADGLGPGSDLGHHYWRLFAPSSNYFEESGSPALALRKEGQLRLLREVWSLAGNCQIARSKPPVISRLDQSRDTSPINPFLQALIRRCPGSVQTNVTPRLLAAALSGSS